jgi:hypothetical protein
LPISNAVRKSVWVRDAGCCAICRERVYIIDLDSIVPRYRAEVAHIVAEQQDGPRGSSLLTPQQRNQESNLLLLCFDHHAEIDTDVIRYPVKRLLEVKAAHVSWVANRLQAEVAWRTKLHNFFYLNIPRLQILSAMSGVTIDLLQYGDFVALHDLGLPLARLMEGYKQLLERVQLKAIPMEAALECGAEARGWLVSFDTKFRTKNIDMPRTDEEYKRAVRGNLRTDPHIYVKIGSAKITLVIDPRWITTTSAFVHFRPSSGQGQFAGLGIVNSVEAGAVSITPLIIGLPSNPFLEALYG